MTRENRWLAFAARTLAVKTAIPGGTVLARMIATLLLAGSMVAQQPPTDPAPDGNDGILGPQLIAWSEVQRPEPVSPQQHPDAPQAEPDSQQQTARTLTGVIAKVENSYVLQTTGDSVTYKLDDADKAKPYEGKRVRVEGILDPTTRILHVSSIQLLS